MSKRTSSSVSNGSSKDSTIAEDKQKKLLQENSGHFSMIKMLHLADLITELNGMPAVDLFAGSTLMGLV